MTEISDKAVWAVCKYLQGACNQCPRVVPTQYGDGSPGCYCIAHETSQTVLRAVAEHPVGLPEGWVASCKPTESC